MLCVPYARCSLNFGYYYTFNTYIKYKVLVIAFFALRAFGSNFGEARLRPKEVLLSMVCAAKKLIILYNVYQLANRNCSSIYLNKYSLSKMKLYFVFNIWGFAHHAVCYATPQFFYDVCPPVAWYKRTKRTVFLA